MIFFYLWILIQIITESLPISSSGHVQLLQWLFQISIDPTTNTIINFLLHIPALFIILLFFWRSWIQLFFPNKKFNFAHLFTIGLFVGIADLVTGLVWLSKITESLPICFLPIGFIGTAMLLYASQFLKSNKNITWSKFDAFILGVAQSVGLLPGFSRFAVTYVAGLWLGYRRRDAFSLSFLIQTPLIVLALLKSWISISAMDLSVVNFFWSWYLFFGIALAIWCSYKLFSWVAILIEKNKIWYFSGYMIIPISISLYLCKGVVL